jgi:hypothetical protein
VVGFSATRFIAVSILGGWAICHCRSWDVADCGCWISRTAQVPIWANRFLIPVCRYLLGEILWYCSIRSLLCSCRVCFFMVANQTHFLVVFIFVWAVPAASILSMWKLIVGPLNFISIWCIIHFYLLFISANPYVFATFPAFPFAGSKHPSYTCLYHFIVHFCLPHLAFLS